MTSNENKGDAGVDDGENLDRCAINAADVMSDYARALILNKGDDVTNRHNLCNSLNRYTAIRGRYIAASKSTPSQSPTSSLDALWHKSTDVPFTPLCGEGVPNQATTPITKNINCPKCLSIINGDPISEQMYKALKFYRDSWRQDYEGDPSTPGLTNTVLIAMRELDIDAGKMARDAIAKYEAARGIK